MGNVLNRVEQPVNADQDDNVYNLGGTVNIDVINELTTGSGVTIDGVLLKDGTVTKTGPDLIAIETGITAFATGGQASAVALTEQLNDVTTCVTAGDSVKLLTAATGLKQKVKNSGATTLAVFPFASDSINALAVNLSVDILPGGVMEFIAISDTVWETAEGVTYNATTSQKGSISLYATDNAGNHDISLTNASHGQDTVTSIPDPGGATGTVMLLEMAQSVAGVNSFTAPIVYDTNTTITAFSTGGQASAVALTGEFNNVTTVAADGDSVKLLTAVLGQTQTVKNSGASTLAVFPFSSDSINALAADLSIDILPGGEKTFRAISGTVWETQEGVTFNASTTQTGSLSMYATDNAANHDIVFTNASMGQDTVISTPDPGGATGTNMLLEGAQTVVGIQTFTAPNVYDTDTGITAYASGGQANAVALLGEYNDIKVCATAGDSVKLLTAVIGQTQTVKNNGATTLAVFPNTDDIINTLAANESIDILPLGEKKFTATSSALWETNQTLTLNATTTQTGSLSILATDNAANHEIVLTNSSHGQDSSYHIPDSGLADSYILTSTAAITVAEADVIDGAVAGTQVASKVVIADANINTGVSKVTELHIGATGSETKVTSTGADINLLDGSLIANTVGGVAPILDANKALQTNANVGTAGSNVTAVEYGDGYNHVTVLILTGASLTPTIPADAEGAGAIIYTFPAGDYVATAAHMDITAIVADSATNAADIGIGSLISSGDIATLTTATMEDWVTGQTIANISSPATEKSTIMTAGVPEVFEAGDSHVAHINIAGTWNNTVSSMDVTGTITLYWTFLGA